MSAASWSRVWQACWAWRSCPATGGRSCSPPRRTLFERIAAQAPTVLVFVDLHWADRGLDFVEDLLAWARNSPIFVVAPRPELLERRPDWGSAVRSVTRINLEPLAAPEMAQLLEGRCPVSRKRPRTHRGTVGGDPLYAVETVRMLLDTGWSCRSRTTMSCTATCRSWPRRDAAGPDRGPPGRQLTGRPVAHPGCRRAGPQLHARGALAAVSGRDLEHLDPALERLTKRQLLMPDNDPAPRSGGASIGSCSPPSRGRVPVPGSPDRRTRHLAAPATSRSGEEELAGVLANHYLDALPGVARRP